MLNEARQLFEWIVGEPGTWQLPRIIFGVIGFVLIGILWKSTEVVGANEQAYRVFLGNVRFVYYDSGEGGRFKRFMERLANWKKARALRKSAQSNQPHLQLEYGEAKIYGPGRYFKVPFTTQSFVKMDATTKNIDMEIFVKWQDKPRGADQHVQVVIRVANLFLWKQAAQNVEGTLDGIAKEHFNMILTELGADVFVNSKDEVKQQFIEASKQKFANYGAEIDSINFGNLVYRTDGWLAEVIQEIGSADASTIAAVATTRKHE